MIIGMIDGVTRVIGKSQGYLGLPVRDEQIVCSVNCPGTPSMTTAWAPTPAEVEAINAGAAVHVRILGQQHPPIMVDVGPIPSQDTTSSEQCAVHNSVVPDEVRAFVRRMVAAGAQDADIMIALESFVLGVVYCLEGMFGVDRRISVDRLELMTERVEERLADPSS